MRAKSQGLAWYELVGWLVNVLMIIMAALFILINYGEGEMRAVGIGFVISICLVALWTWTLLFYGKSRIGRKQEKA
jgi:hypothetical protein